MVGFSWVHAAESFPKLFCFSFNDSRIRYVYYYYVDSKNIADCV